MKNIAIIRYVVSFIALVTIFTACSKDYSVETGASLTAQGTLDDANGNCMKDTTYGTFYGGVLPNGNLGAGYDSAYVLINVNVTATGSYNITSITQNGMYFSDSGYFVNTGLTPVKLYPVGTPITPGTFSYTISFDSSTCYFDVVTKDSTGTGRGGGTTGGGGGTGGGGTGGGGTTTGIGSWQFTTPSGTISGTGATGSIESAAGLNELAIGATTVSGDTALAVTLSLPSASVPTSGTFKTGGPTLFIVESSATGSFFYEADALTSEQITFTITSYDATKKELIGTFKGTAKGPSGSSVPITNGAFDVAIQ